MAETDLSGSVIFHYGYLVKDKRLIKSPDEFAKADDAIQNTVG